ncbi:ribosomal protein S5, C-terminal domain-containing protein [Annulohypoxylon maeteangense]|uniref:ribosomal protein S5, C-terminal domain-containing protein n=1 Tax=Annulohypoxylon maeteangense TaxID=1927788 RepID=UPI00200862FD|nr:ribosomal protein S5, C-terminal domain-containing protein [Annulohypoxylon maeteangense]KAI0885327.1 ribosomal protein S5, C-terminal domain-containing protein [Annulohypoxylon maeteangense]
MSVARPARCLLSRRFAASAKPTVAPSQCYASFHSSAQLASRRKPRFKSIRAEEMGLVTPQKVEEYGKKTFPSYTPEEIEVLKKRYTPEQMAALEAGEAAIDPKDLTIQGRIRRDPYKLPYLDDFSKIYPIIDKRPQIHPPPNPNARFMTEEEHTLDLQRHLEALIPKDVDFEGMSAEEIKKILAKRVDLPMEEAKYFLEPETMVNSNGPTNSAVAPALGKKLAGVAGLYKPAVDPADEGKDDQGIYQQLKRRTGLTVGEILDINTKILVVRFVHNQTRLGKIRSLWMLAIAGNGNGRLGIGEAKSVENEVAKQKAKLLAIQNMQPIRRYEGRTIYGSVKGKVGATIVEIDARPPGFGLRASHRLFEIFRAVGIKDIAAKMPRSRNPMNSVKACVQALQSQKDPEELAIGRGKKLVDVRKVYYGGRVY